MEQMRAGDRKTFSVHGDTMNWYTGSINDTSAFYIPKWCGNRGWSKPADGLKKANYAHQSPFHPIFCRMTPVKRPNGEELKLSPRVQADLFMTIEVRHGPQ